ncbi:MAG TPA: lipase maturation factor family protein, partial [Geobacteraceae bacterium]
MTSSHLLPWLFPRLLGGVYCLAFASLLSQVMGLYGSHGILPIRSYLATLRRQLGTRAWYLCPTLFWINSSDRAMAGGAIAGLGLSLLLMAGAPAVPLLVLLWLLYLSYAAAGQEFLSFQWDALLLEAGFMTIFLPLTDPAPPLVVLAYRFFLFRFMLSAGVVKLRSGDPTWRNLTALSYHYETQPIPNRLGWYAHQLPPAMQKFSTLGTFFFELAVPLLALGPAPARLAGFLLLLFFQLLICATGNYGFFNLLTMVLLVPLLDDRQLGFIGSGPPVAAPVGGETAALLVSCLFVPFLAMNIYQLVRLIYRPTRLDRLLAPLSPFMITNPYGLFAVMTTNRFEFVIEGSSNLEEWRPYEFHWKPGDPHRPPRQAAPHQPRLDWQMWFAALDPRTIEPWLGELLVRLLEGSPPVLALFRHNPFPDAPPAYLRLTVYRYHFTTLKVRHQEGRWWERTMLGRY